MHTIYDYMHTIYYQAAEVSSSLATTEEMYLEEAHRSAERHRYRLEAVQDQLKREIARRGMPLDDDSGARDVGGTRDVGMPLDDDSGTGGSSFSDAAIAWMIDHDVHHDVHIWSSRLRSRMLIASRDDESALMGEVRVLRR